jgi:hypothetical protein
MSKMSDFIHNSPGTAGFYRDRESAIAEGVAIKRNAASIPDRPSEPAQAIRARRKQALLDQKSPPQDNNTIPIKT